MSSQSDNSLDQNVHEAKWEKLNETSAGAFQARVGVLLKEHPAINLLDARIKTLAEDGWHEATIAYKLGYEEKTVYNRASKMRKIADAPSDMPFRWIFVKTNEEWDEIRAKINGTN